MGDLRFAARMLARNPAFTLVTALLLAVGIGANAVIFSLFDAVLSRPLAVRHPEELVRMVQKMPQLGTRSYFPYEYYRVLRDHATTLAAVFGETEWTVAMNEPAPPEQVRVRLVTPEFFDVLGVPALYGRALTPGDAKENPGAPPAVLSYGFWQRRFHGDPGALGKMVRLHGHQFVIVGVLPREFNGTSVDTAPDLRVPLRASPLFLNRDQGGGLDDIELDLAGRLKPGVTRAQAQAECLALWRPTMERLYGKIPSYLRTELAWGMELDPLERGVSILRERYGAALRLLFASVGLLLLLVCANVGGLLLARGAARREEVAIRLAVGATPSRLVRLMLTESLLLVALGAAGGLAIAFVSAPLLVRALPSMRDLGTSPLPLALHLSPDRRVLAYSLAVSALAALIFGLAPAIAASRTSLDSVLRGVRASGGWRGRQGLVVFQVALCTLLLAGAGLLVRSFEQLHGMDPGFDRDHIVTFTANPELSGYAYKQAQALRLDLIERVRNLPGVVSAGTASRPLMRGSGMKTTVAPAGQRTTRADFLNTSVNSVSLDYFDTMGMRILEGRGLTVADSPADKPVHVVVNQAFVRRFFPNVDPIGKRFGTAMEGIAPPSQEIVGVVSDAKYRSLREPMTPTFYIPAAPSFNTPAAIGGLFTLYVRTHTRPESIIQPVRQALAALDPALPFTEIHTMAEEVDASTAGERLTASLASLFGALAALLASVGIYGLLAYGVAQRRREIGIRMALGARPVDIGGWIGRQALVMVVGGVLLGLGAALMAAPWARSLLYDVAPSDPVSLVAAALFVALVAAAATTIPALRASRIEPAAALRQEN